jgi:hypothetical protein
MKVEKINLLIFLKGSGPQAAYAHICRLLRP